jgi:hypothetical protein
MHSTQLRQLTTTHPRYWSFKGVPTTVALPASRFAKSLNSFTAHTTEPQFRELLSEFSSYGCPRPSSYADVFHERYHSPRVLWSVNAPFADAFAGGWQEAIRPGVHWGTFFKYDMRSAYLWAATLGMPDTRTYARSRTVGATDGLYRIRLIEPNRSAPFPFNQALECIATNQEIEMYSLKVAAILDGVTWTHTIDAQPILDAVRTISSWKLAGRAYWGRWAQSQKLSCVSEARKWTLPNIVLNIPWAHVIVARVKMRLWENSHNALHVYVDSVLTTERLRTGDSLGDWRLEKTYRRGLIVRGTGQYGDVEAERLERMAGVSHSSDLRINPVIGE